VTALEALGVRKTYGGVVALDDATFTVRPRSVHALLGQNGAGKSTLVKVMTGAIRPDTGTLRLAGQEVRFTNTADAVRHGVAVVAQELSLFPHLDILSNLFPMREPRRGPLVDRGRMLATARPVLESLGVRHPPATLVGSLSLAERQLVEIAKALVAKPRVLLLDEPTSALETGATQQLLGILRVLREADVGVVYVSHILEEVMSLCDEVTVLRDGRVVMAAEPLANLTLPLIVDAMLGDRAGVATATSGPSEGRGSIDGGAPQEAPAASLPSRAIAAVAAAPGGAAANEVVVDRVSTRSGLSDVSLRVRGGEVVGLAGLAGSGPLSVLGVVAGLEPLVSGEVTLPGGRPRPTSFRQAIDRGVAYVSGDRRRLGLMLDKPIWENIVQVRTMGMMRDGRFLRIRGLQARAQELARALAVRTPSVMINAGKLSGGNQQKVVIAKWLDSEPTTILLDDPTRGVDVGARVEINGLLHAAAARGAVVIFLSTDLEELATACHRVVVFYRGSICGELSGPSLEATAILRLMNTGVMDDAA
jgi:ABC-type sugar transport system ATPase subunit